MQITRTNFELLNIIHSTAVVETPYNGGKTLVYMNDESIRVTYPESQDWSTLKTFVENGGIVEVDADLRKILRCVLSNEYATITSTDHNGTHFNNHYRLNDTLLVVGTLIQSNNFSLVITSNCETKAYTIKNGGLLITVKH